MPDDAAARPARRGGQLIPWLYWLLSGSVNLTEQTTVPLALLRGASGLPQFRSLAGPDESHRVRGVVVVALNMDVKVGGGSRVSSDPVVGHVTRR